MLFRPLLRGLQGHVRVQLLRNEVPALLRSFHRVISTNIERVDVLPNDTTGLFLERLLDLLYSNLQRY